MNKFILILMMLILTEAGQSQNVEVTIASSKNEYSGYTRSTEDSIIISYKIKNTGNEPVVFRLTGSYKLNYISEPGFEWGHCFFMRSAEQETVFDEQNLEERRQDAFITINPGDEFEKRESYRISWLCRGAPPRSDWTFDITYSRNITVEDNYYFIKDSKKFVKAWTGDISSNTIRIKIKNDY